MPSWEEATTVHKLDTKTYSCTLYDDWCIGSVPNGGYVTGCILQVVATHFSTALAKQNQPHTIALHAEFLRRTQAGPALFKVDNVKLGRQTSVVHVHMSQEGREEVVAYVTNSNMDTEEGVSFESGYELRPPPPAVDLVKLEDDMDPNWRVQDKMPFSKFRKASQKVKWHFPRNGQAAIGLADEWLCFADGSQFTNSSIGFVADMFPQIVEAYRDKSQGPFWYPTLLLNIDIKKALPAQGAKWLAVRVQMKKLKNGRMDLEVHVHDAEGDLVALSHHVSLVLDASRNIAERRKPETMI
ncbi:thioesterase-like superfamily-domain-containing protein [Massariosphaeria phaeospora]|uniref:Thioesterase-like superfamily-domain-containing protein n=1 Tax=Massariosphaeria phaeospora TaxID=100035 RepID=A0A7C8ICM2_9PLEO|nr:thioesterase-like superfamily-domain-containing protein [Massariosphaeria phaeospora]